MKSVAIVGFSDKTLPFLSASKADEIWTLNHAYLCVGGKIPRIDRLFEIHKKDWFLRKEIPKSKAYWEWLQEQHEFPVYMQHKFKAVPSSVAYPMKDVVKDLFPNLLRRVGDKYVSEPYFTSTAAFMIALAIHELTGVKGAQIELYGIDMESDTEYGYQKPGGEFMIGLAVGRGIKVIRPEPSELCRSPLYGYDVVPYLDRNRLAEIHDLYREQKEIWDTKVVDAAQNFDPKDEQKKQDFFDTSAWSYIYQGAMLVCEKLMLESDYYISRHVIEIKRTSYVNNAEYFKGMSNQTRAEFDIQFKEGEGDPALFKPLWDKYMKYRAEMFGNAGAVQVINRLMRLIDFMPVSYELEMSIREGKNENK